MPEATLTRSLPARRDLLAWLGDRGVYVALALLVAFNLAFTANFATVGNLRLQLIQVVPVAIVALGMALVIAGLLQRGAVFLVPPSARWSTPTTTALSVPATCRRRSGASARGPASDRPATTAPSSGASWRAWPVPAAWCSTRSKP